MVTRDIESYQRLIDDLLAERIGLKRYFTYVMTKTVKAPDCPPFAALLGPARK